MKNHNLLVFLAILTICCLEYSESLNVTHFYCKKAAATDPNVKYGFCIRVFKSNPHTNFTSLEDLVQFAIKVTVSNSTNISSYISKLLNQTNMDKYTRCALEDCLELYSMATTRLNEANHDVSCRDYYKANLDVSASMDSSATCEDGFKEKRGSASPLAKENAVFFQLNAILLSFINMLNS